MVSVAARVSGYLHQPWSSGHASNILLGTRGISLKFVQHVFCSTYLTFMDGGFDGLHGVVPIGDFHGIGVLLGLGKGSV